MSSSDPNLKRTLSVLTHQSANCVLDGDHQLINFASNDYLGLTRDPRVIEATIDAVQRYGTGSGSSPLLSGHSDLHQGFADFVCDWKAGEGDASKLRAVLFPSGYAANLSVLLSIVKPGSHIFCDRKNHASIIDGIRLANSDSQTTVRYYRHCDCDDLERLLAAAPQEADKWIVSDSVFSMDGTIADVPRLQQISQAYQAGLVIDEAHATGVIGHHGAGCVSFMQESQLPMVVVGTMSKALAASGGFVVSDSATIDILIQTARPLIYSTALSPASVAAAWAAGKIARTDSQLRQRLNQHVHALRTGLLEQGWTVSGDPRSPLFGVIVGAAENALVISSELRKRGIFAPAIRPPTVKPLECRVRISPTATMIESELKQLLQAFAEIRKTISIPLS